MAPPLQAVGATQGLDLQLSTEIGNVDRVIPVFREDAGPDLPLSPSAELRGLKPVGLEPPFRPAELPLRLAQMIVPERVPGKQPRWSSRYDTPLDLQPARGMNMPGAAGTGRPRQYDDVQGMQPVLAPPVVDDEAPEPMPGGAPNINFAPPADDAGEEQRSSGWVIPPIRWLGSTGYTLRRSSSNSGVKSLDQLVNGNLRASSYIYAPWFATVSGDIGVVTGVNEITSGDGSNGGGESQQTRHMSLVGGGNLDLFPASRFPFNASFSRSDSRVTGVALSNDYTDTRFGLRQSYRTEDSQQNASVSFDHSSVAVRDGRKDTVNALYGSYTVPIGAFNNNVNARLSVSDREGTGEGSSLFTLNSTHTLRSENNFSLQAYSNYTDNKLRYGSGTSLTESRGQYMQLSTSASWQPEFEDTEDLPLTLTGGLVYFDSRNGSESFTSQTQRVSGTAAAYYRFSPNLSVNGSGTVNHFTSNGGKSQLLTLLSSGVTYAGDPLMFGNFSYNWNTGANMNWQSGSGDSPSTLYTSVQAGHSLGRNVIISPTDSVSLTFSQNVSAFQNQSYGSSSSLTHSAMASYRLGWGDQFNGAATTTFSDVVTNGTNAQHYQSLNVGLNGFGQINPRSSASVNLSFNYSDQTIQNAVDVTGQQTSTQRMTMAGTASYNHVRFAGVPGLRYTFLFTADTTLRDARMLGDVNGQVDRARHTIDNRLDYRIGMLDLRLSATMNDVGGKKNALIFFQATRQIGSY